MVMAEYPAKVPISRTRSARMLCSKICIREACSGEIQMAGRPRRRRRLLESNQKWVVALGSFSDVLNVSRGHTRITRGHDEGSDGENRIDRLPRQIVSRRVPENPRANLPE